MTTHAIGEKLYELCRAEFLGWPSYYKLSLEDKISWEKVENIHIIREREALEESISKAEEQDEKINTLLNAIEELQDHVAAYKACK